MIGVGNQTESSLTRDFARFSLVGLLGFLINLALLYIFYKRLGWPIIIAQFVSGEVSLFHNFLWHHHWTYKGHNSAKSLARLVGEFHATTWAAIAAGIIIVSGGVKLLHMHYALALIISSAVGWLWNFGWSRFYIWRRVN